MHRTERDLKISETVQSLRRIFKAIQDYSQEVSSSFGITGPQLWALKTISEYESLPLGELSRKMYLHPSTVTGVVDRLEAKGYVSRDRDREDRRVVKVHLTDEGKELIKKAPNPVQGKMIYGLRNLKTEELHIIYRSIKKLAEIVEAENVKATFFFDKE
ncbi:MAG: MarR family transcriptional regulator [Syntrophorhabdales bacterium]|jgi:DNA-binding MarR family transcriptional regulator